MGLEVLLVHRVPMMRLSFEPALGHGEDTLSRVESKGLVGNFTYPSEQLLTSTKQQHSNMTLIFLHFFCS